VQLNSLIHWQIGQDITAATGSHQPLQEGVNAHFKGGVVIAHHQHFKGEVLADFFHKGKTVSRGNPALEGQLIGAHKQRTVGAGLGKGELQLDDVDAKFRHDFQLFPVVLEGRVAAHHMGHDQQVFVLPALAKVLLEAVTFQDHIPSLCWR